MLLKPADFSQYIAQLDPQKPLPGSDQLLYVPLDEVRGEGRFTSTEPLERPIRMLPESCQLFSGFPGSGKTTELKRLAERFERTTQAPQGAPDTYPDLPAHVVFINADDFIDIYAPITIADVLRVIAYQMDREATEQEGGTPDGDKSYLKRIFDFFKETHAGLKDIKFEAYGASFMLELKNNPTFYAQAEEALRGRFQRFVEMAHESIRQSVERLKKRTLAQRVLVIVDGLDKLNPRKEEEREPIESSVELVFSTYARMLRLPCHVIYTFPLWLRYRGTDFKTNYDKDPLIIPMVKIRDQHGHEFEPGIQKLMEVVSRRIHIKRIFGEDSSQTLKPLVLASGGYLRDLIRLVRNVLFHAQSFPVEPAFVERVIQNLAEDYKFTIYGTDLDLIVHIAQTHELPNEDRERLAKFGQLLERRLILAYRNGLEWYDVHPMVRRDQRVKTRLGAK